VARAAGVRPMVFKSSREMYGDLAGFAVPATEAQGPKNLYGTSRVARETSAVPRLLRYAVILRLANVYRQRDYGW
jgi:nucleoside-diphosphate-sugar epimerase